jgi:hypothetical protein
MSNLPGKSVETRLLMGMLAMTLSKPAPLEDSTATVKKKQLREQSAGTPCLSLNMLTFGVGRSVTIPLSMRFGGEIYFTSTVSSKRTHLMGFLALLLRKWSRKGARRSAESSVTRLSMHERLVVGGVCWIARGVLRAKQVGGWLSQRVQSGLLVLFLRNRSR